MIESTTVIAERLTKHFGDVIAVNDLSLIIHRGEIYGLLGLNGAGKTTTIRLLLGMIKPGSGSVALFGTRIVPGQMAVWQRVGYMVESPHAYPDLTVRQNLEIFRRLHHLKDTNDVKRIVEQLGLISYADRRAGTLSLGNAQRLGLAKALIHHPDLLILDEPANALDPAGIVEVRNLLHDLAKNDGVTIFISSHILSEITRLATRIGVVHGGRLISELDPKELSIQEERRLVVDIRNSSLAKSALEKAGIPAIWDGKNSLEIRDEISIQYPDKIAKLLGEAGCPPTRLVVEQGDLESYFLRLVGQQEVKNHENHG